MWEEAPGKALLFSMLIYPQIEPTQLPLIGLLASIAVVDGILEYYIDDEHVFSLLKDNLQLKWPNDILINGKKICGILSESGLDTAGGRFVIVGIGLNVNQDLKDFSDTIKETATSLFKETDKYCDRNKMLSYLLESWDKHYRHVEKIGWTRVSQMWSQRSGLPGKFLTVNNNGKKVTGEVVGLELSGALRLKSNEGSILTVYSGEIS